jgi:hypothetical protein
VAVVVATLLLVQRHQATRVELVEMVGVAEALLTTQAQAALVVLA